MMTDYSHVLTLDLGEVGYLHEKHPFRVQLEVVATEGHPHLPVDMVLCDPAAELKAAHEKAKVWRSRWLR